MPRIDDLRLKPHPALMLWRLARFLRFMRGHIVTEAEIIDCLWGDDASGGPDDITHNLLCTMIAALQARGYPAYHAQRYNCFTWGASSHARIPVRDDGARRRP